jgi:hypothetical protein
MKKHLLVLFGMITIATTLFAQTNLSGNIANNTILIAAESPYIVTGNLNVNAGVTLTVESGVELRFNSNVYLRVFGTLAATGATFTASESTSPGAWQGIDVSYQSSAEYGTVTLNNCIVEYAQSVHVRHGLLTLTNNTLIKDFSSYGLDIYTRGTVDIEQTNIENCSYPVYFRSDNGNGSWTVGDGVNLTGNGTDYVFIDFRDVNSVFNMPDPGIPYYYDSELRVNASGTVLVDPGVTLYGNTNAYINVYGKFKANGTVSEPVTFTNEPSNSHWRGFNFQDAAIDTACILTYSEISGANLVSSNYRPYEIPYVAVEILNSSPAFNNCTFTNNRYNLVVTGRSNPVFSDCDFQESSYVAKQTLNINMDLNAMPVFNTSSVSFNNSEARAIGIVGNTVFHDAQMKHHSFTGFDSLSYTLYDNVIIHDTASLVIDPGIVIKCTESSNYIQANGTLTGIGTESSPIVFTHINDDDYGRPADTHNDGTTSISNSSSGRIILSSGATSTIEHWHIRYAGWSSSYYAVYAYNGNIVRNCDIRYSHRGILFSGDAQILNNNFNDINDYPLARRMNPGAPVLIGNTVDNSGHLGIFIHDFLAGTYSFGGLDISTGQNVAYIIDGGNTIPTDADVTIDPGTVIKFSNYYGKLLVRGGLKAEGTADNRIIFTSIYDNSASGNTNNNTGADPVGYKWDGIEFYASSNDGFNSLKNTEVRYVRNSIRMTDCKVTIDSTLLNFSDNYALSILGSADPVITNSAFNNLSSAPVHMDMFANPTFSGNTVSNAGLVAISINGGTISGTVPARSFAGYDTITYVISQTLRVDDALTIPAGIVFKGSGSAYFDIYGTFNVLGTASNPVVFTTLNDDAYGKPGDTEQNGQGSISTNGNRLVFRDLSDDNNVVDHALFRYSYSYGIYAANCSPTISNTVFYRTSSNGLELRGTAAPTVEFCTFEDLQFPIITSLMTFPGSEQGNVLSGNTAKGILIFDDETLTQNYTLTRRSFAGIDNIPYVFNRYNVGTSAVLTIEPGVVLKFRQNGYLNVSNGLIADGGATPDSTIVFTSDRDDFYGGDTYGDGDANVADNQWWWGIYFLGESIDASCYVNNAIIKNGTRRYSNGVSIYNRGAVTIDNAAPTIENTLFIENFRAIIVRNTSLPTISNCDFVETDPTYGYAVWNETGVVTVTAENCWWNDATGPAHPTLNPDGLGERVSDNVDFTPWISQTAKPIMGDVSLNGEVMPYDASLVLQHTVGNITMDAKQQAVADVSGDQTISSFDASLILQYSIGLITNFEQQTKKSAATVNSGIVSAPATLSTTDGSRVELPLSFTTPAGIKSVDLHFDTDPGQVRFTGLDSKKLPQGIMVASGYREETGVLKISLTSAYDLNLAFDELGLLFERSGAGEQSSTGDWSSGVASSAAAIELVQLKANEIAVDQSLAAFLESSSGPTGIEVVPGLSTLNLYSSHDLVIAELHLAEAQSRLVLTVHDMAGRVTNNMTIENADAGGHRITFLPEQGGGVLHNKLYMVTVSGDDFVVTRKLVLR